MKDEGNFVAVFTTQDKSTLTYNAILYFYPFRKVTAMVSTNFANKLSYPPNLSNYKEIIHFYKYDFNFINFYKDF